MLEGPFGFPRIKAMNRENEHGLVTEVYRAFVRLIGRSSVATSEHTHEVKLSLSHSQVPPGRHILAFAHVAFYKEGSVSHCSRMLCMLPCSGALFVLLWCNQHS
jgi:hypothetical protein